MDGDDCNKMCEGVSESTVRLGISEEKQKTFCDWDIWVTSTLDVEAALMRNVCLARLKYDCIFVTFCATQYKQRCQLQK